MDNEDDVDDVNPSIKAKDASMSEVEHIPIFDEENFQEEQRL